MIFKGIGVTQASVDVTPVRLSVTIASVDSLAVTSASVDIAPVSVGATPQAWVLYQQMNV